VPVRPILRFPDPRLKLRCAPVTLFDDGLRRLSDDLLATMRAAPGVGITAAHIGVLSRIFVLELSPKDGVRIFVNPDVFEASKTVIRHTEGSVSMPGATEEVERAQTIRVRYQDLDGAFREEEARDFTAVCIQHEIDQLDGIFWLQRLSRLKRERLIRKWEKQNGA
jgi:peptide deformylase